MSVEAMTMVTILGPENMVNTAIRNLVVNRDFHPVNAIETMADIKKLMPFDTANPYTEQLAKVYGIAKLLDIPLGYRNYSEEKSLKIREIAKYLDDSMQKIKLLKEEREKKTKVYENSKFIIEQVSHFDSFDVELSDLFTMRYIKFRFGRVPKENEKRLRSRIESRQDVYYISSGELGEWGYGAYFSLPKDYMKIDSIFASAGFERIRINVQNADDTPQEVVEKLRLQDKELERRIAEIDAELETIKRDNTEKILEYYSLLKFDSESYELRSYAGYKHGKFFIVGWIPQYKTDRFVSECETYDGFACVINEPGDLKDAKPPVKLKTNFFTRIYQPFVEMYGMPSYNELDPSFLLAITYTLFFGIMFGDIGQGFCLFTVGLLLWKKAGAWLGRIISLCGFSSMIFGTVYGSIFGNEELMGGFKVFEGPNTNKILLISVVIGVVTIMFCMIFNIINGIKQKDIKKILFSPNGVAGFIMYMGIAIGAALKALKGIDIFNAFYVVFVVVIPLIAIFAAEPLTKIVTGQKDWKPESIGMFVTEGFFELFEVILSYFSNTVSFLRIGAYAVSHAGMMMVVYLLSGGTNIFGIVLGNILITGIETALVCIQVMRLEYYEMFSRFYDSGGEKFKPVTINYNAAE